MAELVPTSGKEWREKVRRGVVLTLPSGFVARIRSVQPSVMFSLGKLPDSLTPVVAALFEGDQEKIQMTMETFADYEDLVNAICKEAMIEPKLVAEPKKDDELGYGDLEWPDKLMLMGVIGTSTSQLEKFRAQQAGDVEAMDPPEEHAEVRE